MRTVQLKLKQILGLGVTGAIILCIIRLLSKEPGLSVKKFHSSLDEISYFLPLSAQQKWDLPLNPLGDKFMRPPVENISNGHDILILKKLFSQPAEFKDGVIGNYEPPDIKQFGPGEAGKAVLLSLGERDEADRQTREYGFNMVASDKVAMNRTLPDTRLPECRYWHYPEELPTASVILVFFNEGWSTIIRTVHSVINTSPDKFLKEVILIDDGSDYDFLKDQLENYIKQFNGLVKLFRNPERRGLITARTKGAEHSTGDVIVFLDAHCECNRNWLPPLLTRIKYNRTILAVPIVDVINWNYMDYSPVYGHSHQHRRGIFEWGFFYKEGIVPQKVLDQRKHPSEPYASPTHAGGLLAMDRDYFFELGAYDPGLKIWGGENYELSFKVWMCGGSLEWVPCSRVGHIYRGPRSGGAPKKAQPVPKVPHSFANYLRVVEVWMEGEFKEYFYTREPWLRGAPYGDVSKQLQMKHEKNCKSFRWFMENVAYDVYDTFPPLPPNVAWGEIKIWHQKQWRCWNGMNYKPVWLGKCQAQIHSQLFRLNSKGQLGLGEHCIVVHKETLHTSACGRQPEGPWEYDKDSGQLRERSLKKCIGAGSDDNLHMQPCDADSAAQKWEIHKIYPWKV